MVHFFWLPSLQLPGQRRRVEPEWNVILLPLPCAVWVMYDCYLEWKNKIIYFIYERLQTTKEFQRLPCDHKGIHSIPLSRSLTPNPLTLISILNIHWRQWGDCPSIPSTTPLCTHLFCRHSGQVGGVLPLLSPRLFLKFLGPNWWMLVLSHNQ